MKRFIPIQALRTATDITRHVSKIATDINRLTTRQAWRIATDLWDRFQVQQATYMADFENSKKLKRQTSRTVINL